MIEKSKTPVPKITDRKSLTASAMLANQDFRGPSWIAGAERRSEVVTEAAWGEICRLRIALEDLSQKKRSVSQMQEIARTAIYPK